MSTVSFAHTIDFLLKDSINQNAAESLIDRRKILIRYIINNGIAQSQKDLGHKLGYSNESSFSQVINGKVKTPNDFPKKLKNLVPNLNINWLLTGEGEMLKEAPDESSVSPPSEREVIEIPLSAWNVIEMQAKSLEKRDNQIDELIRMLKKSIG